MNKSTYDFICMIICLIWVVLTIIIALDIYGGFSIKNNIIKSIIGVAWIVFGIAGWIILNVLN